MAADRELFAELWRMVARDVVRSATQTRARARSSREQAELIRLRARALRLEFRMLHARGRVERRPAGVHGHGGRGG